MQGDLTSSNEALVVVPEDFPRDCFPAALTGAQPKFATTLIDGKYTIGMTAEQRENRYLVCQDLVAQLVPYCARKQREHPDWTAQYLLAQVDIAIRNKDWALSSMELDWIMAQLRKSGTF